MTSATQLRTSEDGFTLVELLVAIMISMIVLLATLQSLDLFSNTAATQTRLTDANAQVRNTMDRTVDDLRGASSILRASATDLVYAVPAGSTTTRVERLCLSSGYLYGSSSPGATATVPAGACSTGTKLGTLKSTASTAFTYDGASSSATPATVKNVGLTFSLDASGGSSANATSTLRASAARRAAGTLPLPEGEGSLDTVCNASGALLSLSANVPNAGTLSVTYANDGGISLGTPTGNTLQVPEGITTVVATITDAAGATKTIRKGIECNGS
jgi:prepilin-type N-terminal cleavage/methylation domain-containing protein